MASGDVALVLATTNVLFDEAKVPAGASGGFEQNTTLDVSVSAGHYTVTVKRTSGATGPIPETPFDSTKQYKVTIEEV